MKSRFLAAALAAIASLGAIGARAQEPSGETIHLIVAYAPGGTGDFVARVIAPRLQAALGQPVIVENKPGASGNIGARAVATAKPDGLTFLVGQTGEAAINKHWLPNQNFDSDAELVPVAFLADSPLALVVPAASPWSTMAEFIAGAPKATKPLTYANSGIGTPSYFAGEWLKARLKIKAETAAYGGAGPALNDLIGGHVDYYFPGLPPAMPQAKAGMLKIIAVSSGKRAQAAPDIPTIAEAAGIPDYQLTLWAALFAPKGAPAALVQKFNREVNKIVAQPDVARQLLDAGAETRIMSDAETAAFVHAESAKYQAIIKETGVKPQ
jgi:tripartite-type tricarboxylate transporter receptor subunit TctC